MSLFSNALVQSRLSSTGGSLLGASDTDFMNGFNRELGLEIFSRRAANALTVAGDPSSALGKFKEAVEVKEPNWLARYKDVKAEFDELGYPAEDAHQRALAAAKALADQDIQIVAKRFPYILDEGSLVSMTAGFQVNKPQKSDAEK